MFQNAQIILLDEATSSVDTEAGLEIRKALDSLRKTQTTIVNYYVCFSIVPSSRALLTFIHRG